MKFWHANEGNYIQPLLSRIIKEMSPLCKQHRDNPEHRERFELMVCGRSSQCLL
jgi:lysyl-tRNA synthetase class 2